ncbi:MAG: radical SAM protein [Candidatus Lokiarchaeota archaeon]|nr:radical SAM protein [Candidatus Lokiarchaeota archaeon]MBD3199947.1 radical SAM protein [Candidatus Lokiarchaeota archaeon]
MVRYIFREFKTAINKLKFPDSWFWARYTSNPYSGCQHACIYCDARSNRYYLTQNFEEEIIIKKNFAKVLEKSIKNSRSLLPDVIGPGGVCDAYQPIEKKEKNTRKLLKVIEKYEFPVNLATKSDLVVRDLDLFKKIATDTSAAIGFSITTMDNKIARFVEPYSSSPQERIEALRTIKEEAPEIQVGTYFMPIIPFLEDANEQLENVVKKSKLAGADFILFAPGLTLRDSQKEFFVRKLRKSKYSNIVKPLLNLYSPGSYKTELKEYVAKYNLKLYNLCKKFGINIRVKRWLPSDYRKWNYKIAELLLNEEYTNSILGNPNKTMKWAGLYLNNLEESIINYFKRGELSKLKNFTPEIIEFIHPYLKKGEKERDKKTLDRYL